MLHVFKHPNSYLHEMGPEHLEAPTRVEVIEKALNESSLKINFNEATMATYDDILSVHSEDLFNLMRKTSVKALTQITNDTSANIFTFEAALTAVGGALNMIDKINTNHSFSMLRPPGHHATKEAAMGFCFFNNIAIAAQKLLMSKKRILILDVDNHFGNGTADIFSNEPNLLYISLHADPEYAYPGTGHAENVGTSQAQGKTVNIPLPWQLEDADYLIAMDEVVLPIIDQFKPETILVSLGLDGLKDDPYGTLGLTSDGFYEIGKRIGKINSRLTNSNVGCVLEGGYKYSEIGNATVSFFTGLLNPNGAIKIKPELSNKFTYNLRKIKAIQRNHWFGL